MALLPTDSRQQKRLLIGLVPLLALFGYWYFVHGTTTEELDAMRTHLEELQTKNQAAIGQMRRGGPDLEQRVALYEQYMARLEELIPEREEVPQLLHTMTLQAEENGVDLTLVRPEGDVPETFYTRQTYQIGVVGDYHGIGRFLTSIGSLPRIVAPIDVGIGPVRGVRADRGLQASFRIQTFVLPEDRPMPFDTADAANVPS
ncbi:MAG: type 4a pilus biogenesis protein PilO [Longimicrobiales bacterium]